MLGSYVSLYSPQSCVLPILFPPGARTRLMREAGIGSCLHWFIRDFIMLIQIFSIFAINVIYPDYRVFGAPLDFMSKEEALLASPFVIDLQRLKNLRTEGKSVTCEEGDRCPCRTPGYFVYFENSLYNLYMSSLSDTRFANIYSQPVACLSIH